ncbi:MAG: DUF4890 domain-containing protein [Alistipes senegalensis]
MKKKIFAAVTALCLMAGTSVFAQQQNKPDAPKERPTAEQMAQRKTDRMTEQLKLNEAQAKQVYAINLAQIKEMIAQREKMEAARKAEAEKMKSILTTEQFMQWSQMQQQQQMRMSGQRGHGPQAMHKGGKDGKKTPNARITVTSRVRRRTKRERSEVRILRLVAVGVPVRRLAPFFCHSPVRQA